MSRRVIGVVPDKDGKETKEEWATRMIKDWDITEPMYWTRKKKRDPFEEEEERLRSGHEGGQKQDRQLSTNDTSRKYRLPIKALGRRVWNRVVKQSQNSHNAQMSRRAREVVPYKDGKETDAEWATRMIKDWDITEPMYWTRKKKYDPFEDAEKRIKNCSRGRNTHYSTNRQLVSGRAGDCWHREIVLVLKRIVLPARPAQVLKVLHALRVERLA